MYNIELYVFYELSQQNLKSENQNIILFHLSRNISFSIYSNAVGDDVRHVLRMAVAGYADPALRAETNERDVGTGIVDGYVHRGREPATAVAHRVSDGRSWPADQPDGFRATGAHRMGTDPRY